LLSLAGADLSGAHRLCLFADRRAVDRVADGMPDCVMVWSFLTCVEVLSCHTIVCRLRHEYVCPASTGGGQSISGDFFAPATRAALFISLNLSRAM